MILFVVITCNFNGCHSSGKLDYQILFCYWLHISVSNTIKTVRLGRYLPLTHWGRVTHICVGNLTIIWSDNGLSPGRRQAIIWTNAGLLLIGILVTNFSDILIGIKTFSYMKMHLKMSSAKWRPFCLGLNVLRLSPPDTPKHVIMEYSANYTQRVRALLWFFVIFETYIPWHGASIRMVLLFWCKRSNHEKYESISPINQLNLIIKTQQSITQRNSLCIKYVIIFEVESMGTWLLKSPGPAFVPEWQYIKELNWTISLSKIPTECALLGLTKSIWNIMVNDNLVHRIPNCIFNWVHVYIIKWTRTNAMPHKTQN